MVPFQRPAKRGAERRLEENLCPDFTVQPMSILAAVEHQTPIVRLVCMGVGFWVIKLVVKKFLRLVCGARR
jgi:hypothetical protein